MNESTREKHIAATVMILLMVVAGYLVVSDLAAAKSQQWPPYVMGGMTGVFAGFVACLALRNVKQAKYLFTIAALSIPVMCGLAIFLQVDYFIVLRVATLLAIPLGLVGFAFVPKRL